MSHIPVSAITISDGVVIGALIIRLMTLSMFFCACFISVCVGIHVSAPYVIIGIRQAWTSFHIDVISMCLNSSFPARLNIVWRAASDFAFMLFRWASRLP